MSTISKDRLLIKKIELENIGRFYGKGNSILLSESPKQNITIIMGESGMGKSTIFAAIYWCLYGVFRRHVKEVVGGEDYGLITSAILENLKKGGSVNASVSLTLNDQKGQKYILTRELVATMNRESSKRKFEEMNNSRVPDGIDFEMSIKLNMKNEQGEPDIERDPRIIKNEITKYFPINLSDFFLFDGEDLVKFKHPEDSSEIIKNGIEKISGLPILDHIMEHSEDCRVAIEKHIGGKNAYSLQFVKNDEGFKKQISDAELDLVEKEKLLGTKKEEYEQISSKIEKYKISKDLQKRQIETLGRKKIAQKELLQNNDELKNFLFETIPQLLIRKTLINSEKIFEKLENEDKIPPSITRAAIEKILNSNPLKCVCGREFKKNDTPGEPWNILNKIKGTIIEADISQGITSGRFLISNMIDSTSYSKLSSTYEKFKEKRREIRKTIQQLELESEDLAEQIAEQKYDEDVDLGKKRNELFDQCSNLSGEIARDRKELEILKDKAKKNETLLREAIAKETKYDDEKNKMVIAEAISKLSGIIRKRMVDELRNETQVATSKYFMESAPQKEVFSRVNISPNYDITARDDRDLVPNISKGQAHVLGLSYVAGSREITHTNTFLIIDSPLHNISGIFRNEISNVLSKYLPGIQLVLLVTDTEYLHSDQKGAEPVKNILRKADTVWKEYEITKYKTENGLVCSKIEEYRD